MKDSILLPLVLGCVFFLSPVILKFVPFPAEKDGLRKAMMLNDALFGVYNLFLALFAFILKLDTFIVTYFIIGGIFAIGLVILVPALIKMGRK